MRYTAHIRGWGVASGAQNSMRQQSRHRFAVSDSRGVTRSGNAEGLTLSMKFPAKARILA
ncbi:hypothetical protein AO262_01530 [Pseudomonas fluorescens ABAC62]|nr:hypothetical protein AO262_01530 [Pseudomonas fluorescens ABAC62]